MDAGRLEKLTLPLWRWRAFPLRGTTLVAGAGPATAFQEGLLRGHANTRKAIVLQRWPFLLVEAPVGQSVHDRFCL